MQRVNWRVWDCFSLKRIYRVLPLFHSTNSPQNHLIKQGPTVPQTSRFITHLGQPATDLLKILPAYW